MVRVAVAGGLGGVGSSIVDALVFGKKHQVCILTRKKFKKPEDEARYAAAAAKVSILEVDYTSVQRTCELLDQHGIETIVSTLNIYIEPAYLAQINLIRAAAMSKSVTRFIPSEFNIDYHASDEILPYNKKICYTSTSDELAKHPSLEYTLVYNGFFLDYFGLPRESTRLLPIYVMFDMENCLAALPRDGNTPVVVTHTRDVGRFVESLLELPQWPKVSRIIGDKLTLNEMVQIAESIRGQKFTVEYETVQELRSHVIKELPGNISIYDYFDGGKAEFNELVSWLKVGMATGAFDLPSPTLNEVFPELVPQAFEVYMKQCWGEATPNESSGEL